MSPEEEAIRCNAASELLERFETAARNLMALHERRFRAVLEGGSDLGALDLDIIEATEAARRAEADYRRHDTARLAKEWQMRRTA
ncbi:MAG: hypothetical protein JWN34_1631 [Bryobacterales bacterium]|nr:hypothetical protein [Bryobacterales bacterium]